MSFRFIALFAAAAFAIPLTATAQEGRYQVAGTNLDGSPYGGEAEIVLSSDTTCVIRWLTGATESSGICMRNDDSFAAGYQLGNNVGLVIYKIMPDGTLNGLWTLSGAPGNGTEVLTPIR